MKSRVISIFWGIVMMGAGIVFFLREFGIINFAVFSNTIWAIAFGVLGVSFLLTYFINGFKHWGWLFPALILSSVGLIIGLADTALGATLSGAPILLGIAIPFIVAYALEPRSRRWALIPAWVMIVLTSVIFLEGRIHSNLIGAIVLFGIGLPFLLVYLMDKTKCRALIPFGVLTIVGMFPLLDLVVAGQIFDMLVIALLAVPFYVMYFWSKKNWWALIPAGVFTSVLLTLSVERLMPDNAGFETGTLMGAVMLMGIGLTFGLLWLKRVEYKTDWALYPTLILLLLAMFTVLFGNLNNLVGPVLMIAVGVAVVGYAVLKKSK